MIRSRDSLKQRGEPDRETLQVVDLELESREAIETALPATAATDGARSHLNSSLPAVPITFDTLLARCPRKEWTPNPETMLFLGPQEQVRATEVFRELRSRLYRVREKQRLKTLLVTSALPTEGRSFVAANLAQVLALQPDCKVLLIDADLRSPQLHSAFGTTATPGLGDYLVDEAEESAIVQKGPWESLFLIPSGRPVPGPTEVLANGRLKSLIERAGPLFDWIILDSPAAIPVSDAGLLGNVCDGVLMVVRSNSTSADALRKAREKFREGHLVGVVLNSIPMGTAA